MRVLGFSKRWQKLEQDTFSTFRFARRDKDLAVGEVVQLIYKPRSREREILGKAEIISKERRWFFNPDEDVPNKELMGHTEAKRDGFRDYYAMRDWLKQVYGNRIYEEPMNKLTLRWRWQPK